MVTLDTHTLKHTTRALFLSSPGGAIGSWFSHQICWCQVFPNVSGPQTGHSAFSFHMSTARSKTIDPRVFLITAMTQQIQIHELYKETMKHWKQIFLKQENHQILAATSRLQAIVFFPRMQSTSHSIGSHWLKTQPEWCPPSDHPCAPCRPLSTLHYHYLVWHVTTFPCSHLMAAVLD